ncbi:hypothetical protein F4703DRAFT_1942899 [Phycomyces blakesleeanus]
MELMTIQLRKGTRDRPEHLGVCVVPSPHTLVVDKGDSIEKIKVSISLIKAGMQPIVREFSRDFEFKGVLSGGRGYNEFITLQHLQNYLTDDQLTLSIVLAIEQKIKNLLGGPSLHPKSQPFNFSNQDLKNFQDVTIHVFNEKNDGSDEMETNFNHDSTASIRSNKRKRVESTEDIKSNKKITLHSHKFILASASPWFRDTFLSGMKESTENEVKIRGVDPNIFKWIFDFSYGKDIKIKNSTHGINIIKVADRLQFKIIKDYTFLCLQNHINKFNIFDIWETSDLCDCVETRRFCMQYMRSNYVDIFLSPGWLSANDEYALKAIKIDGLKGVMDETIFYRTVMTRRRAAVMELAKLRITKEKEWKEELLKAPSGSSTPSGEDESEIVKEVKEEAKVSEGDVKVSEGDAKVSDDNSREDTGGKVKEDSKDNGKEKMDTNVKVTDSGGEDSLGNVKAVVETEAEKLKRLEKIRWEEYIKKELESTHKHFETMILHIRFPQMGIEFLANTVEKDDCVMQIPGIKDVLIESYRHKAFLGKQEVSKKY